MQVLEKNNEAFLGYILRNIRNYPKHVQDYALEQSGFTAVIGWDQEKAWVVCYAS